MTGEGIVRSILLSAVLALGVVGCPPEPPDDDDVGIGGSAPTGGTAATGGRAAGGTATGGNGGVGGAGPVAACQTVTTLPEQGSSCRTTPRESRCLTNGDRCVCMRDIWYCNNACPSTPPTPDTDCSNDSGRLCTYANGATCACRLTDSQTMTYRWRCVVEGNGSTCPAAAPGDPCNQPGLACDYPGAPHQSCTCVPAAADSGARPTWFCIVLASCPVDQPVYPTACTSTRFCTYGDVHCTCPNGGNWICGDWPFLVWLFF